MNILERDKQIIDLYLNHPELSNEDIANRFNISKSTVSRIARINNLPRRSGNSGVKLSIQQTEEIKQKYLNCIPLIQLQKEYGISYDRIKNITKDCETISSAKRLNPNLNENYFKIINSNEKAYWLGWIISDGAITNQPDKSKFALELTLKKEDEKILHLLESDLGVINKVYPSGEKYIRFNPEMSFADESDVFRCFFSLGTCYGYVLCLQSLLVGNIAVVVGVVPGCERVIHTRGCVVSSLARTANEAGNHKNCYYVV